MSDQAITETYIDRFDSTRRYCDADSHIMETFDWLKSYADPDMRDRLSDLGLGGAGAMAQKAIDNAVARQDDAEATAALEADVISSAKGWGALGAFNREERKRALDHLGFEKQLVFSTFAASQYLRTDEVDIRYGGARAHNRAMADFCKDDSRLIAVGSLPLEDADAAVKELDTALKEGCKSFWIPASPAGDKSPGHPDFDPVWARMAEAHAPIMLHIGQGTRTLDKKYENHGRAKAKDWLGGGENLRVLDYMVLPFAPEMFLSAMIFHGAFERHPGLRCGVIELGGGWVPSYMTRLDMALRFFSKSDPLLQELSLQPSEYMRRQIRVTPFAGEDVGALIRETGPELYLFSSDYPHPEGTKDPIGKFERTMEGISEADKRAFYSDNFDHMFA